MVRGIYTGASAMAARVNQMNVISNNLANVNTTGFKKDLSIFKSHPEMLVRRTNDNGIRLIPPGSIDLKPIVGNLGTGVELNEIYNQKQQGSLQKTDNPFDFAIEGKGYFEIQTPDGIRYTRNGAFKINDKFELVTKEGFQVMGEKGIIRLKTNNFEVTKDGKIYTNESLNEPFERPVQIIENGFENAQEIDQFKIVSFPRERYLQKEGSSFYSQTEESGDAFLVKDFDVNPLPKTKLVKGFLETSNVNAVQEMVKMIEAQRAYEASQKTITSSDEILGKLINNMASV